MNINSLLRIIAALLLISVLPAGEGRAQSQAEKNVIVSTKQEEGYYDVFVQNKNPFDITLTLEISGSNYRVSRHTPIKGVYQPYSSSQVLRIYIVDKNKSFKLNTQYSWFVGDIYARHNESYVYALPFRSGESHRLGQGFEGAFSHQGKAKFAVDFMMAEGTPVCAAREGIVIQTQAHFNQGGPLKRYIDNSNFIVIRHDDGTLGEYAHLKKNGVLVEPGDVISKGEKIGLSGNTGYSSGPHLHFMVSKVLEDGSSQSLPFRFSTSRGIITEPQKGEMYTAN